MKAASPLRLMCVLAHPDDESLATGGVLAQCAEQGVETFLVTATRGERGRYGDSAVWVAFQEGRQKRVPVLFGMLTLFLHGLKRSLAMAGAGRSAKRTAAIETPLNRPVRP